MTRIGGSGVRIDRCGAWIDGQNARVGGSCA
jgi:hypothetical protein